MGREGKVRMRSTVHRFLKILFFTPLQDVKNFPPPPWLWNERHKDSVSVKWRSGLLITTKENQNTDKMYRKSCFKVQPNSTEFSRQIYLVIGSCTEVRQHSMDNPVFLPFNNCRYISRTVCTKPWDTRDLLLLQVNEDPAFTTKQTNSPPTKQNKQKQSQANYLHAPS